MKQRKWLASIILIVICLVISTVRLEANGIHEFSSGKFGSSPQQPQVTVAPDGSIYLVYGSENTIYCALSRDRGKTFSTPVALANEGPMSLGMHRGPRIAATKDFVVITAVVGKQGKGRDGSLRAWRSADRGKTWGKSVTVNDAVDSPREGLHGMAPGPGNFVFAAWLDLRALVPGKPGTELYGAVSHDGGLTWRQNVLVYHSRDGSICECCHPSVAINQKGQIYVMWRNALGGARDMYLTASADGGKTFAAAQKLGEGTWPLNACPMDGGEITVTRANQPETAWRREDRIFVSRTGGAEQPVGRGRNPVIAYGTKGRYVAWQDSSEKSVVLLAPDAKEPVRLGTNSTYVDLIAGPGGTVIAAWEEGDKEKKIVKVQILS